MFVHVRQCISSSKREILFVSFLEIKKDKILIFLCVFAFDCPTDAGKVRFEISNWDIHFFCFSVYGMDAWFREAI